MKIIKIFAITALVMGFIVAQVGHSEDLPIIAYWSFDNDSGSTLIDSGPNKLDAKLKSIDKVEVTTAKGMKGKALLLNAEPKLQYVVEDKNGWLNLKPPYTICCWINKTGEIPKSMCVFCKKPEAVPSDGYDLRIDWNSLNHRIGNDNKTLNISSAYKSIKDNTWHHIAVTNDGKKITHFINGEPVESKTPQDDISASSIIPTVNKYSAVIGNYVGRNDAYNFIGLIDELYIIGKALNKDELFKLAIPDDK